ncbi:MAG: chitobiase/beta-hexosaminidase C-terminal domain-containing protein, partial [Candidatus Cloacimonetes bacterium]|nr:chitobiase/beta-hexosaminidase C-terminal domain-containing protein [Candidatus Cloacimonadota bacterium]
VKGYLNEGLLTILAVNNINKPQEVNFEINDPNISGKLSLPFENREITIQNGKFSEYLDGYNSRCFQFEIKPKPQKINSLNLTINGDFEENPTPGVVAGFYASVRKEKGATYFCDSKVYFSGRHSLRINNPTEEEGMRLRSYSVKLQKNKSYSLSIMAKAKQDSYTIKKDIGFWKKLFGGKTSETKPLTFKLKIADETKQFDLSEEWQEYIIDISNLAIDTKSGVSIELLGKGTAWFDLMQVIPGIKISNQIQNGKIYATISSNFQNPEIRYTLDGTEPTKDSPLYTKPFIISQTCTITAARFIDNKPYSIARHDVFSHKAIGKKVLYNTNYLKYEGGGELALVNGLQGNNDFKNNNWQGFIANNMDVIIDLGKQTEINEISINFLEDLHSWIFLPTNIKFETSQDGKDFKSIKTFNTEKPSHYRKTSIRQFIANSQKNKARYIRIFAKNPKFCPKWHRGDGGKTWIFVDEIIVK